jgi:hypothetical protein
LPRGLCAQHRSSNSRDESPKLRNLARGSGTAQTRLLFRATLSRSDFAEVKALSGPGDQIHDRRMFIPFIQVFSIGHIDRIHKYLQCGPRTRGAGGFERVLCGITQNTLPKKQKNQTRYDQMTEHVMFHSSKIYRL